MVIGPQIAQSDDIVTFVNNQHRQRPNDVKTGNDEDERQEDIRHQLLHLHNAEGVVLLFIAVLNKEMTVSQLHHPLFYRLKVTTWSQAQFQGRQTVGLVKDITRKGQRCQDILFVILRLLDAEDDARRIEVILHKAFSRIGHIQLSLTARCIDFQRLWIGVA